MNEIFKKLLSTVLSVSFLSVSTISLSSLAEEDYCFKNSKGGYAHPECANDELGKVGFYKTADFVDIENLGMKGDEERYAFNLRALDEVFEKKKLISNKDLREQRDLLNNKCEVLSNKCKDLPLVNWNNRNIFYTISASLIGTVAGLFTFKKAKNPTSSQGKKSTFNQSSQDSKPKQTSKNSHSIVKTVFSTLLGGLIGGLASIIGIGLKNKSENYKLENEKQDICNQATETLHKLVELDEANEAKANMLNMLLFFLEHPEHITFDMVNYVSRPKDNDFFWDQKFAGINYTKEEMESFPQKFKEIATKIRKNLEENHELDTNINSAYSPYGMIPEVGN